MRTTEMRMVALRKKKDAALTDRRANQQCKGLTTACILLSVCLLGLSHALNLGEIGSSEVTGLYGSVLYEGAGGYVFLGVLAFVTGAFLTILCFRLKRKQKTNKV